MNPYLITYKDKQYATNADNVMEAEDKFINFIVDGIDSKICVEVVEEIRDVKKVVFF